MKNEEEEEDEMNLGLHLLILSLADEERAYRLWWKLKERNIGCSLHHAIFWELPCD
jgi:hypothetical protein